MKNNTENIQEITLDQVISIRKLNILDKIIRERELITDLLVGTMSCLTIICLFTWCTLKELASLY